MIHLRLCSISASVLFLVGAILPTSAYPGQARSPSQSLAAQTLDGAPLVTLRGNTHPLAQKRYDRGAVEGSRPATRMMLLLKRTPEQESSLQSYLQQIQSPTSVNFRKFLTPEEFGQRFGISDTNLDTVQTWLAKQGFVVSKVNKGRMAIEFSGTVGQLQQAFHTTIHRYLINGIEHRANSTDPAIPAPLSDLIAGVASLNDFKPSAHLIKGPKARWNAALDRFIPDLTITNGSAEYLYTSPGDAATIYDAPNSLNTHLASNQTQYDGTGVTIGVIGNSSVDPSDVENYRTLFSLPGRQFSVVIDGNEGNLNQGQDETEALLDSEVSGALAPGADVILYTAGDTEFQAGIYLAIYRALDDNQVNIISLSYGECEASLGASGNLQILNAWEQAAAQGITVTVSSGDSGSAGCDNMDTETVATQGLAVNGLASTPFNIAVGGTDFDVLGKNFSTYISSTNSSNYTSALSYIPENPWNNSTASNDLLAANSVYANSAGATNIVAGGGGASSLGSGGQTGYPKPPWQQGFAPSNSDSVRDIPDVALLAADGQYGALWAICGEDECPGSNGTISGVGGTSAAAPAFAGILAMVNQKVGASTRMGQANWILYPLAQTQPSAFHQITRGNNSVHCTAQSPNCGPNGFLTGYNSGSGYNLATGLGSVDISNLVNAWSDGTPVATTTTLSLNTTTFTHGTPVEISVSVSPSTATGDVVIENNYASQTLATTSVAPPRLTLSGGSGSLSYSQLPGGSYHVYASFPGSVGYAGSVSQPVQVTVSPENSITQLSVDQVNASSQLVSIAGQTVPLGSVIWESAQPIGVSQVGNSSPVTDATGTVTLYDFAGGGMDIPFDGSGNAVTAVTNAAAGNHSISADYSGDLSYNGSTSSTVSFTVSQAPTSISVSSNLSSIANGFLNLTAQISAKVPAYAFQPSGTVTFTDTTNNTVLGTSFPSSGTTCSGVTTLCILSLINVTPSQLANGTNNIMVTYSGDGNFIGSGPSAAITVACTAGCSNGIGQSIDLSFSQVNPATGISAAGGAVSFVVEVNPAGGFTGAVKMTCTVTGKTNGDVNIPTCSFNPTQVNVASSLTNSSTLTVNTTVPTTGSIDYRRSSPWSAAGGAVLAALFVLGIPGGRSRRRIQLGALVLCLMSGWVIGCGGGGGGSSVGTGSVGNGGGSTGASPGTTPDTYTVTVRAADVATGTVTAEENITFNVP
jgi:trimeric autotransporter adhesin